jgi:hypothetical protein
MQIWSLQYSMTVEQERRDETRQSFHILFNTYSSPNFVFFVPSSMIPMARVGWGAELRQISLQTGSC